MQASMQATTDHRAPTQRLAPLVRQYSVLLTSYRRDGTPVGTPVNIAVEGDHAYIRTWDTAWKLRRKRNNSNVLVAPSTLSGKPTGPAMNAQARILSGDESKHAAALLAQKHPILHGVVVPLIHRLQGHTTMHIELRPVDA
jgi:PPOX class probable F420-dependent enzyme